MILEDAAVQINGRNGGYKCRDPRVSIDACINQPSSRRLRMVIDRETPFITMALNNVESGVSVNGTSAVMNLDVWRLILDQVRSVALAYICCV